MKIIDKRGIHKGILAGRTVFKPFQYEKLYDLFVLHERIHWTPSEIVTEFAEDTKDFNYRMTENEKRFIIEISKFFTQADVDVLGGYVAFQQVFNNCPEAAMLLSSIAAREAVHADAYSTMNTAIGLPDTVYHEFMQYAEMREKHDYVSDFDLTTVNGIARALALYGLFTEGVQLFASFAMLMNFSRFGKMKGMTKVVTWSIRDEQVHIDACVELYKILMNEYPDLIDKNELEEEVIRTARTMVELEDAFIDRAFELANNDLPDITKEQTSQFIRWLCNDRLARLGLPAQYPGATNPFPWIVDVMYAKEHQNFFEGKSTEYTKGGVVGDDLGF